MLKDKVKDDFNRSAQCYDQHAALQRFIGEKLLHLANTKFLSGDVVLDLGCGTGYINRVAQHLSMIQVDLAFNMCKQAKKTTGLEVVNSDMEKLCFADNQIGGIFSNLALQWVSDVGKIFSEFHQLLQDGKYVFLSSFGPNTLHELNFCFRQIDQQHHVNHFTSSECLKNYMYQAGFKNIELVSFSTKLYFPTSLKLMHYLKSLGANYKQHSTPLTKTKLAKLEALYQEKFVCHLGLPSTWQVFFLMGQKVNR